MVQVQKKERETVEAMLRRFRKKLQRSGKIWLVRKRRYREETLNKRIRKERAMRRLSIREKIALLKRQGKLAEYLAKKKAAHKR